MRDLALSGAAVPAGSSPRPRSPEGRGERRTPATATAGTPQPAASVWCSGRRARTCRGGERHRLALDCRSGRTTSARRRRISTAAATRWKWARCRRSSSCRRRCSRAPRWWNRGVRLRRRRPRRVGHRARSAPTPTPLAEGAPAGAFSAPPEVHGGGRGRRAAAVAPADVGSAARRSSVANGVGPPSIDVRASIVRQAIEVLSENGTRLSGRVRPRIAG